MVRKGFTRAPCPGCGATPLDGLPKGSVCGTCRDILRSFAQQKEEAASQGEMRPYITVQRDYALPALPHELVRRRDDGSTRCDSIREPMHRLQLLVSQPSLAYVEPERPEGEREVWPTRPGRYLEWRTVRLFPNAVADALRDLYSGIYDSLEQAHAEGGRTGRNLLMGLASGSITNDEFNTRAARLDGEQQ